MNSISKSLSTPIQSQFHLPSSPFPQSQSRHIISSIFINTNTFKNPLISIRKPPNLLPIAAATNGYYTPSSPEETLYDLLGISQSVTLSEIKRAFKRMALKYHPDVSPPDRADEYTMRFIRVQEAYETLSDPESRAIYDCDLAKGLRLGRWRETWEEQVAELTRRRTVEMEVGRSGKMSWAARIRKRRAMTSDLEEF